LTIGRHLFVWKARASALMTVSSSEALSEGEGVSEE
jgi:hypothetical protein